MTKIRFVICLLFVLPALSGCSTQINQTPAFSTALTATPQTGTENPALSGSQSIPVTWASLNLTGRLVYVSGSQQVDRMTMSVQQLDLKTGQVTSIFQAPDNAWIYSLDVSPDARQLVMTYSPASSGNASGNPSIYIMPFDGSAPPQPLFTPSSKDDEYFQPQWSADGAYIYFNRVDRTTPTPQGQLYSTPELYRMSYPDGRPEKIAGQAFWARESWDAQQLVYVSVDPLEGTNKLFIAKPDGTNAQQVVMSGKPIPLYIDAPLFSPDGQAILFSAVSPAQASTPTWLENLLGISIASAHTIPSDWWSVPVHGGPATQITRLQTTGLFASISPDKRYVASNSTSGIFVMQPDGTGLTSLVNDSGGMSSTISWLP
jgi:Tol biopolymer transport system component